ncbi:unnamed protein product [Oppiella nova]|uniref:Structural maintenance of chromosomes protein n=1 Tax=Oppiella nova TaxID=334625 RepID=A0A7R9QC71_9ACAR|nr:unnamed protein product [Oppiella nova]CAG2162003.1 unnamed protein product [Oppiella nova]
MHIKSIILDGFKSYGTETKIDGFDNLFNAITGLNGSGKSNILDAICFVLGLSRMDIARCNNLRELIYKNGQTGVTKASVTIHFDNKDKRQCPAGYDNYDEIVIRREVNINSRSKYWINGFGSNNQSVTDLFHSVSLNIQNPHFLIMQGRITKVLNMKPHEILSMVEEATGVSMYEMKKKSTQSMIEKKDSALRLIDAPSIGSMVSDLTTKGRITKVLNMKPHEILSMVEEATGVSMYEMKKKSTQSMIEKKDSALRLIDALINETIVPKLDQLKKEQSGLMEFQKISAELESLSKVFIAFKFVAEEENCLKASANIEEKNNDINGHRKLISDANMRANEIENSIKTLEKKKDEEFGGKLSELETQLKSEQLSEAKLIGEMNISKEELKEKEKKEMQFCKNLEGDRRITASKQKQFDSLNEKLERLRADNDIKEENLKKAEKDFEDISAGKSRAKEGEAAATLADQLMTAEKEIATAETDIKKAEMKIKHSKTELNKKETEVKKTKNTYDKDMKEINSMNSEVEKLRAQLEGFGFDEQRHVNLRSELGQQKRQIDRLSDEIRSAESSLSRTRFDFKDPQPNFDRSSVMGVVCNLFRVKDINFALALEKSAGGKLYNVVVRDGQTAKAILDRGQLRDRWTFIPLDRIKAQNSDQRALKRAQEIVGRENVDYAINFIEYEPHLANAMKYVFNDILIVPDMEIAKKVVYDPEVRKTTVTYDGEVFEPSGILSGGSAQRGTQLLAKVAEILDKKRTLEELSHSFGEMETEFRDLDKHSKNYTTIKQNYDLKAREAELVRQRLQQGNSAHILMEEIEALKLTLQTEDKILKDCAEIKKNSTKRVNELNEKLKDSKSIREREHKEAEQNLKSARTQAEKSRKLMAEDQQKVDCLQLEIEELSKQMNSCEQQLNQFKTEITEKRSEMETIEGKVNAVKEKVGKWMADLKEHKRILKTHSDEMSKMQRQRDSVLKSIEENEIKIKQINYDIEKIKTSSHDSAVHVKQMKRKYPWIEEEKHLFGNESTGYSFNDFNTDESTRRLDRLKSTKASLAKTVNMRANIMLSDKEKESEELTRKRRIVATDKNNLITYMQEVDQKKKDELFKAWQKINVDFGAIFSTFLPNSNAKLEAPEGKSVTDGLEVKVAFGDVWKDSLTELSGGQRSLVALSLILALLKYNPAPLYILDEVDAALDQSHTQNTGIMIRNHFRNSQFIIVSLKDDMFNNANVLFKTRFVDGTSQVTRVQSHHQRNK